jgi:hypothetical protein
MGWSFKASASKGAAIGPRFEDGRHYIAVLLKKLDKNHFYRHARHGRQEKRDKRIVEDLCSTHKEWF